jgi:PadR family transcriptional regulator, regulatory protein PadR
MQNIYPGPIPARGALVSRPADPAPGSELLKGTLDMLILKTLTVQPMHGYGIAQHIERLSDAVFSVEQGSLYPALERLQRQGWVTSKWGQSPTGRRARFYTITAAGRRQLGDRQASFDRVLGAIARVMRPS